MYAWKLSLVYRFSVPLSYLSGDKIVFILNLRLCIETDTLYSNDLGSIVAPRFCSGAVNRKL